MKLWKYNRVTGFWVHQRNCLDHEADQWLRIFQRDEPEEFFVLSKKEPKHNPTRA